MATKLQLITAMYDHALNKLTGSAATEQQRIERPKRQDGRER